ncbi:MAG: aa3-type cytochrome oxidase subunit IV, partial [Sciscionella sp.]
MKIEGRIFEGIAGFAFLMAVVYGIATWYGSVHHHVEVVGFVALTLTGALAFIVGTYSRFVARRIDDRPEDNDAAEISDGSGDVGFFSPGSYWPVAMALAAATAAVALAFW